MMRLLLLTSALLSSTAFAKGENWQFVQSVGGLSLGVPERQARAWVLPVQADVSGLASVKRQAVALNSALACVHMQAVVEGRNIFLTVVTGLVRQGSSSRCPSVLLDASLQGHYKVFYRGPDEAPVELSEIELGPL